MRDSSDPDRSEEIRHTALGYDFLAGSDHGQSWRFDVFECQKEDLGDLGKIKSLFDALIRGFVLQPLLEPQWQQFSGGGVTGICLLAESHLSIHTFPEHGVLWIDLLCCRSRESWDFEGLLERELGDVRVFWSCDPRPFRPLDRVPKEPADESADQ